MRNQRAMPRKVATANTSTKKTERPNLISKETLLIGGHINGGIKKAIPRAEEITARTLQIFLGSPQMWASPSPTVAEITSFKSGVKEKKLGPVFVHGNYLVNLATADATNLRKSLENMHNGLRLADTVGASGLIFHPGSSGQGPYEEALIRLVAALKVILDGYSGQCKLLLEVCAGSGNTIGSAFSQFKDILEALDYDERLGVCWDTCHLYSAGYDIATEKGFKATVDEFEELVGFEWLYAIHANDSKTPFNSRRDRHENIGEGTIGRDAFHRMLHHPKLRTLPWILEVPGFEKKGPDKKNIDLMKQLAL